MAKIAIVEDHKGTQGMLVRVMKSMGHSVETFETYQSAANIIGKNNDIQLFLIDQALPDGSGLDLLKMLVAAKKHIPAIVVTGDSDMNSAIRAIKMGAIDYITKPIELDVLQSSVDHYLSMPESPQVGASNQPNDLRYFRCESKAMQGVYALLNKVAKSEHTVVIQGESGVGKELIAREIHEKSGRHGAFVPVDCGAIPLTLIESELFGHMKGSFTDAMATRIGVFEQAHKGTLFLDEIGNLPMEAQTRLLRVIQERCVRRVGGTTAIDVDVRIIVATNAVIPKIVQSGHFREDLWYRLSEFLIEVPPLRQRRSDILQLAQHFLAGNSVISKHTQDYLQQYLWPGNVRELKSCINRALVLSDGEIKPHHCMLSPQSGHSEILEERGVFVPYTLSMKAALQKTEQALIDAALEACDNNKLKASQQLGMYYSAFYRKAKHYGH